MSKLPHPKSGILDISPYVPGKSKAASDKPLIKLSSNENPYGCSEEAKIAYANDVLHLHRYPDGQATKFKAAIQEALGFKPEKIVCGAGSDEVIQFLISAYAGVGDDVLQCEHGFLMYQIYAKANGARPVFAKEKNLTANVDALLQAVTGRTKLVFVANPNNPTGTFIKLEELKRLRHGLPSNVILVVDEAYVEYANLPGYESAVSLVDTTPNTVVLRTLSKAYGLPGLRLGFGYMPEAMAEILNRIRGPFNVSSPAIAAGAAAMRDQAFIDFSVKQNTKWRTWMTEQLSKRGFEIVPSAGNFVLIKCGQQGLLTAGEFAAKLSEKGIVVREVGNYGLPDYVRITIGTAEENQALIQALDA